MSFSAIDGAATITLTNTLDVSHAVSQIGAHAGKRAVLAIITDDTISIVSINQVTTGNPGGWNAYDNYSAQGRTIWLYDKTCDAAEYQNYTITFTPTLTAGNRPVVAVIADFSTTGPAIRAVSYADQTVGSVNTAPLVLPSLTATNPDDLFAFVWSLPFASDGRLHPQSPLTSDMTFGGLHVETAHQNYGGTSPTGTRSYALTSGSSFGALGTLMVIGDYDPPAGGGWGVGQIRMGAN